MMPTNEERRKVAQKLRNSDIERHQLNPMVSHATVTICGSSIVCIDEESLRMALDYLADLIEPEPTVDRDALLDIARQMEWASEASYEEVGVVSGGIVGAWAEKIKEACSEVNNHEA